MHLWIKAQTPTLPVYLLCDDWETPQTAKKGTSPKQVRRKLRPSVAGSVADTCLIPDDQELSSDDEELRRSSEESVILTVFH